MTKPFENSEFHAQVRERVRELSGHKSIREIANDAGYDKPNIISMYMRGETQIPIDKFLDIARALELSDSQTRELFVVAARAHPKTYGVIMGIVNLFDPGEPVAA